MFFRFNLGFFLFPWKKKKKKDKRQNENLARRSDLHILAGNCSSSFLQLTGPISYGLSSCDFHLLDKQVSLHTATYHPEANEKIQQQLITILTLNVSLNSI